MLISCLLVGLLAVLQLLASLGIGLGVGRFVSRWFGRSRPVLTSFYLILGLIIYLWIVLGIMCLGGSWGLATFAPIVFAVLFCRIPLSELGAKLRVKLTPQFLIWVVVVCGLGATILSGTDGYKTIWSNVRFDVPLHLDIIYSFVFGENFPPEYFFFAGKSLSYPFFVDFWTASAWWISPEPQSLALMFWIQWVTVWMVVYVALSRSSLLVPWLVLLGGGSFARHGVSHAGLMNSGHLWLPFIGSIWMPQRSAMFGVAVLALTVAIFHSYRRHLSLKTRMPLFLCGLITGLSFLVHGHFAMTVLCYMLLVIFLEIVHFDKKRGGGTQWLAYWGTATLVLLIFGSVALGTVQRVELLGVAGLGLGGLSLLVMAAIFLYRSRFDLRYQTATVNILYFLAALGSAVISYGILSDKSCTFSLMNGWFGDSGAHWFVLLTVVLGNFLGVLVILGECWRPSKNRINMAAIVWLVVFFNCFQLAIWRWDQIKIYCALYVTLLTLLPRFREIRMELLFCFGLGLVTLPATVDIAAALIGGKRPVYSQDELNKATKLRELVSPEDIVIDDGRLCSLLSVAGRREYRGLETWLINHGLVKEEDIPVSMTQAGLSCRPPDCPKYILWEGQAVKDWSSLKDRITPTSVPDLYEIHW